MVSSVCVSLIRKTLSRVSAENHPVPFCYLLVNFIDFVACIFNWKPEIPRNRSYLHDCVCSIIKDFWTDNLLESFFKLNPLNLSLMKMYSLLEWLKSSSVSLV